ncbi:MAG: ATP-dependent DNA ligase [Rickettsiales bacterium]|nr:ATP-dependent DNA ligase [Rickettsiales bacterium]OUT43832.1 MAG: ATP-dependent DNA ligase [Pelagibacteraceae bacterium TMED13]|tara:strand:+ start:804 stop:2123 length:1320 start_codon:yes stop_codon:yes gene_type:complete
MTFSQIIKKIESSNSRLFKEAVILEQMRNNNDIFFQGLNLAYNKLLTFGVKQIPISSEDGEGLIWLEFIKIANSLINRELTGHAARDEIVNLMSKSNKDEWNFFYRRILLKDMRCGVSEKTINNVANKNNFENYQIPVFACQLAQDVENHKKKLIGKKILEIKLDGVRAISILYPSGKVDIFSRNGKELHNFDHIKDILKESIKDKNIKAPTVLDGEIISDNFQNLMKQIHRKVTIQNSDASLYLFDILPFEDFEKGFYKVSYSRRSEELIEWYNSFIVDKKKIQIIDKKSVDLDNVDGKELFKQFNKDSIVKGYEGIMIKDPDSFYECKRSTTWLKSKPFIEISLKVIDFEEGTGRNTGRLGAIIAEGEDEGKFFKINIGSGFTDEQRLQYWGEKKDLIGQIVEVRADSISKGQDGSYWSLRFPRFKTFRGFEKNEKI